MTLKPNSSRQGERSLNPSESGELRALEKARKMCMPCSELLRNSRKMRMLSPELPDLKNFEWLDDRVCPGTIG